MSGVGGIEAEAVMLGQAISMVLPKVVGYKLTGKVKQFITSTDVVLTITKVNVRYLVNIYQEYFPNIKLRVYSGLVNMKWLNQNEGSVFSGKKILFWYNFRQAMMITELNLRLFKFLIALASYITRS